MTDTPKPFFAPLVLLLMTGACTGSDSPESPLFLDSVVQDAPENQDTAGVVLDEAGFEIRRQGAWYGGDFHVHSTGASNDTGGDSFPQDIAKKAQSMGLQFVVLTDHSNSTGSDVTTTDEDPALFNLGPEFPTWMEAFTLSEYGVFWMVSGNEVSPVAEGDPPGDPTGHIGCIPMTLGQFDKESPFVDRPKGQVTGGDALNQALERGCFTVLNHPYALLPWIAYDWTGEGYHGIEVWNGSGNGFDENDFHSYNAWRCDLQAGSNVSPIGASDNHRIHQEAPGDLLNPALGWPTTLVWSEEPTWEGIMEGLKAGDVSIYEGESRLFLDAFDDEKRRAKGSDIRILRTVGALDIHGAPALLRIRRLTDCIWDKSPSSPPEVLEEIIAEFPVEPGETFSHVVTVKGEPGVYSATLLSEDPPPLLGIHYGALSGGFRILGD